MTKEANSSADPAPKLSLRRRVLAFITRLAPPLLSGTLRVLAMTLRIEMINAQPLFDRWTRGEQVIIAFWHNRLLMMPVVGRGHKICIMNSAHRDGQLASRAIERWGIRTVEGSATRGGVKGFLQLVRTFRQGYSLAVVPDGPRGPCYKAKVGVIYLGKATGAEIVPVSYAASWVKRLGSWDRLMIPLPFARIAFVVGEPLSVPKDCDEEQAERFRLVLEQRLNDLNEQAKSRL